MGFIGKPNGLFCLENSDFNVGSYIKKSDIIKILNIDSKDLENIKFKKINNFDVIDEITLQKLWHGGKINNSPSNRNGNAKISLDELVLLQIIKKAYPESIIEHQVSWGRKRIDFKVNINNKVKFIEFLGPMHFIKNKYNDEPKNPIDRKKEIENTFGEECILYPYWIQKCEKNIKAIFEDNYNGLGVLWNCNVHFNDFHHKNSAKIINEISERFKAKRNDSYSYFYLPNNENHNNIEHPIINKILNKEESYTKLLPKGYKDIEEWIPNKIKNHQFLGG